MQLTHLPLNQLKLSPLNVRKIGGKDIAGLVDSIRANGIIQPLLVRADCEGFEVIAGQRRFRSLGVLADEGIAEPVPCVVMEEGDDAKAIEASLAENIARLPMDEIDQYRAFAALKKEGMETGDIASRFGVTEKLVNQRLAIAGLIPPILNAYRREEIRAETLRLLTMATPRQQKEWLKLHTSENEHAPTGRALKEWLFGGAEIPTRNALFAIEDYKGAIASDLFGDERYFADADAFWVLQKDVIAAKREAYLAAGWGQVVLLETGHRFQSWSHVKTGKKKGGKVFIATGFDGEVSLHEGWVSEADARKSKKAGAAGTDNTPETPVRSECTNAMQNYLGLHKHAAVRTELLTSGGGALRLAVAHMIVGSGRWSVNAERQRADSEVIAESLGASLATKAFSEEKGHVLSLLAIEAEGVEDDASLHDLARAADHSLADIFQRLIPLEDKDVLRVLTFVMAETLEAHSSIVDSLGGILATDMRQWWKPDHAFFDLMRDKEAINAMVREVAGDMSADAHKDSTSKVQKQVIAGCLDGTRETRVEGWTPRYMAFPSVGYTERFKG